MEIRPSGGSGHLFFYCPDKNVIYGTVHRQGTQSLVSKGRQMGWPRLSRLDARRYINKYDLPLIVPMRDPAHRLWSAYHNMNVRGRYHSHSYSGFAKKAHKHSDPHVRSVTSLMEKWGFPSEDITWVSWAWWTENVLDGLHEHRSGKPKAVPDIPEEVRDHYADDYAVFDSLGGENEQERPA